MEGLRKEDDVKVLRRGSVMRGEMVDWKQYNMTDKLKRSKKRRVCYVFLETWDGDIGKRNAWLKENHISIRGFNAYKIEWKVAKTDINRLRKEVDEIRVAVKKRLDLTEDEKVINVLETLYELAVEQRNWNAAKAYLQAKGVFIEKREDEGKIDADAYFRARDEAIRRVGGDRSLPGHGLFSEEVREDTGYIKGDNSVGAVEASSEVS